MGNIVKQKADNRTVNLEDIFVWSDGTWCYRYEVCEMAHKSDDFVVIHFGEVRYERFFEKEVEELKKIITGA